MNGYPASLLLWMVNLLLGIVITLIGMLARMHQKSDEEHRERIDKEIASLRAKMHDAGSKIFGIEMWIDRERK